MGRPSYVNIRRLAAGCVAKLRAFYLVYLVVELRVVFKDLGPLLVVEVEDEVIDPALEIFSPFFAVDEPSYSHAGQLESLEPHRWRSFAT